MSLPLSAKFPLHPHLPFPKAFPEALPELDTDWLASHHPILNAKFPPITALLNRPTYHKSARGSPPPCPQISWEPQINE